MGYYTSITRPPHDINVIKETSQYFRLLKWLIAVSHYQEPLLCKVNEVYNVLHFNQSKNVLLKGLQWHWTQQCMLVSLSTHRVVGRLQPWLGDILHQSRLASVDQSDVYCWSSRLSAVIRLTCTKKNSAPSNIPFEPRPPFPMHCKIQT